MKLPYEFNDKERKIIDFSFTKNLAAMVVSLVILFAMLLSAGRWYKTHSVKDTPRGFVGALEMLILFIRDEIAIPNIGKEKVKSSCLIY